MGKHSNFPRRKEDEYLTPYEAALPLKPYLTGVRTFAEPCCADGRLIRWVESFGPLCIHSGDIQTGTDALTDPMLEQLIVDAIITNPPYTWDLLSAMIDRFMRIAPTWLLLEADFKYNLRTQGFMRHCSDVVPIGRVRWFSETTDESKVSYAWYRFHIQHTRGPIFHPLQQIDKRGIRKKLREGVALV
ncbi:unknown [Sinorhizobium phage PBC5]|uniref:DNA methyltransferase n=1 Tax=Sinorhizobium phage PBC5 TaxID=179237 RepID=UPI000009B188|nr:DNA methyltransferase [Sinorhizobium phage PBC5]AAL49599.1 unknown [Sinorhizobium phage PBC5]